MKSIDSYIKLIDQIRYHPNLNISDKLTIYRSFLSADYIAHYGEIVNCLCFNHWCDIGIGHLFDKSKTYPIFRIKYDSNYKLLTSVDQVVKELNSLFSFDLPNDRSKHIPCIKNKSNIRETQISQREQYKYGCYTTYIRKRVEEALDSYKDEYDITYYYNRKFDNVRHLQYVRLRPGAIPHQLKELSYEIPIRPYLKNGWVGIAFNEEII